MTDSLTQKNTEGVNFQPKKIHRTSPSCILQVPPWAQEWTSTPNRSWEFLHALAEPEGKLIGGMVCGCVRALSDDNNSVTQTWQSQPCKVGKHNGYSCKLTGLCQNKKPAGQCEHKAGSNVY